MTTSSWTWNTTGSPAASSRSCLIECMEQAAREALRPHVVFLDPPRAGSTPACIGAVSRMAPRRVVYVSCNPETQKRDLELLTKEGWQVKLIQGVDMFPHTEGIETVVSLGRK